MPLDPAELLAGPRGRRLCLEFAQSPQDDTHESRQLGEGIFYAAYDLDPGRGTSRVLFGQGADQHPNYSPAEIAHLLAAVQLPEPDGRALLLTLAAAVENARYWQEPDGEDVLAATPELQAPLARAGALIANSPHSAWWSTPLACEAQYVVGFAGIPEGNAVASAASKTLEQWRAEQVNEEDSAQRDRPADPRAAWGGTWWSKPPTGLTRTTRTLGAGGPAGLWLVEDSMGWEKAAVRQIHVPVDARAYEIDSPEAWSDLCWRYPLDVTASRRHDWYRITGRSCRWVIPDWVQVAQDFDAVHLTVAGYLSTAGRAVPVEADRMSVLAGWDPDQNFWLTEVAHDESTHQAWRYDQDEGWIPSINQ